MFRRGVRFIADTRPHCTPLDRNERARILYLAEALERRTKPAGGRNGVLGSIGLAVLKAMLLRFHRGADGLCTPSYTVLQAVTGLCRQSIANALKRLEAAGILRITRRLVREISEEGVRICRQGSNLYGFSEPSERASPDAALPIHAPGVRPFPQPAFAGLAKLLGWPSLPGRRKPTSGFQYRGASGQADMPTASA